MGFAEYSNYDGLGLAELVKKKRVKPAELVEAAIERIERHNPQLNAVVFKAYDDARARATTVPAKLLDCVPGACSHAAAFDRLHPGCEGNGYAPAPALPRSRQHRLAVAADALNDAQRPLAQTRKHRRDHPRRYRQRQQS
jgi:hypothetical protein